MVAGYNRCRQSAICRCGTCHKNLYNLQIGRLLIHSSPPWNSVPTEFSKTSTKLLKASTLMSKDIDGIDEGSKDRSYILCCTFFG